MLTLFVLIFSTNLINCVYITISPSDVQTSPNLFGLLDDSHFNFTSLDSENSFNGFPSSIQIQVNLYEYRLNIILNAQSTTMNKNIYHAKGSTISQNNPKLEYQNYVDLKSGEIATVIKNTDLIDKYGAHKIQSSFRITLKTVINNFWVQFYPVVVTDDNNDFSAIQEIYTVQSNLTCVIDICLNGGTCMIGLDKQAGCICTDSYTGNRCEIQSSDSINRNGLNSLLKLHAINENIDKEVESNREKRQATGMSEAASSTNFDNVIDLLVDCLVVADPSTINFMLSIYPNTTFIYDYMNILFTAVIDQVNTRFVNSASADLRIHVEMVGLLVFTKQQDAPWSDPSIVSDKIYPWYIDGKGKQVIQTCDMTPGIRLFSQSMYNLTQNNDFRLIFDFAVAVINLDIWQDDNPNYYNAAKNAKANFAATDAYRSMHSVSGVAGGTEKPGDSGICDEKKKYSIIELNGFYSINWVAHELGHSLGAQHDGAIPACKDLANWIMTGNVGRDKGGALYLLFSSCSRSSFTSTILDMQQKKVKDQYKCLNNYKSSDKNAISVFNNGNRVKIAQFDVLKSIEISNFTSTFPGQCYTLDQQCKLINGNNSMFCNGNYPSANQNNDELLCSYFSCKTGASLTPTCVQTAPGNGVMGAGPLDGTPCFNTSFKTENNKSMVCWKGKCVTKASIGLSDCDPKKCNSIGGQCSSVFPRIQLLSNSLDSPPISTTNNPIYDYYDYYYYYQYYNHDSEKFKIFVYEAPDETERSFYYNSFQLTKDDAERSCNELNATLAVVTDQDLLKYLIDEVMDTNNYAWISGYSTVFSVFEFGYGPGNFDNSLFCQDGPSNGGLGESDIIYQCLSIPYGLKDIEIKNGEPYSPRKCAQDDFCFMMYPSICEFKSSLPPTTTMSTTTFRYKGKAVELTVCDSDLLDITCRSGKQIAVISAYYGRKNDTDLCGTSVTSFESDNCDYDATESLRQFLSHYSSISLELSADFINANPCYGIKKYLIIKYACVDVQDATKFLPECQPWMNKAIFTNLERDDTKNYCKCSSLEDKTILWKRPCTPVATTANFFEAMFTGFQEGNYTEGYADIAMNDFFDRTEVVRTNLYLSRQRDHRRRPKTTTTPACPASLLTQFDDVCPYGTYLCDPTILDDYLLNYTIVVISYGELTSGINSIDIKYIHAENFIQYDNQDNPEMFDVAFNVQIEVEVELNQMGTLDEVEEMFQDKLHNCDLIFKWSWVDSFSTKTNDLNNTETPLNNGTVYLQSFMGFYRYKDVPVNTPYTRETTKITTTTSSCSASLLTHFEEVCPNGLYWCNSTLLDDYLLNYTKTLISNAELISGINSIDMKYIHVDNFIKKLNRDNPDMFDVSLEVQIEVVVELDWFVDLWSLSQMSTVPYVQEIFQGALNSCDRIFSFSYVWDFLSQTPIIDRTVNLQSKLILRRPADFAVDTIYTKEPTETTTTDNTEIIQKREVAYESTTTNFEITTSTTSCPASILTQFEEVCPNGVYLCDQTLIDDYLLNYTMTLVSNTELTSGVKRIEIKYTHIVEYTKYYNQDKPDIFDVAIYVIIEAKVEFNENGTHEEVQEIFQTLLDKCDLLFSWNYVSNFLPLEKSSHIDTETPLNDRTVYLQSVIWLYRYEDLPVNTTNSKPITKTTTSCPGSLLIQFDDACPDGIYLCNRTVLDDYLLNYTATLLSNAELTNGIKSIDMKYIHIESFRILPMENPNHREIEPADTFSVEIDVSIEVEAELNQNGTISEVQDIFQGALNCGLIFSMSNASDFSPKTKGTTVTPLINRKVNIKGTLRLTRESDSTYIIANATIPTTPSICPASLSISQFNEVCSNGLYSCDPTLLDNYFLNYTNTLLLNAELTRKVKSIDIEYLHVDWMSRLVPYNDQDWYDMIVAVTVHFKVKLNQIGTIDDAEAIISDTLNACRLLFSDSSVEDFMPLYSDLITTTNAMNNSNYRSVYLKSIMSFYRTDDYPVESETFSRETNNTLCPASLLTQLGEVCPHGIYKCNSTIFDDYLLNYTTTLISNPELSNSQLVDLIGIKSIDIKYMQVENLTLIPSSNKRDGFDVSFNVQIEVEVELNQMRTISDVQAIFNKVLENCDLIFTWSSIDYFVPATAITTKGADQNIVIPTTDTPAPNRFNTQRTGAPLITTLKTKTKTTNANKHHKQHHKQHRKMINIINNNIRSLRRLRKKINKFF